MYSLRYGGKQGKTIELELADDMFVVRTKERRALREAVASKEGRSVLDRTSPVAEFPEAGVSVLRCQAVQGRTSEARDDARSILRDEQGLRFAGRSLRDPATRAPVVYTENLFVKFKDDVERSKCEQELKRRGLNIKQTLSYAKNAFFVGAPEGTGLNVFRLANELLDSPEVELAHPELIRPAARRQLPAEQWHLRSTTLEGQSVDAHVNVTPAWEVTRGAQTVIAVIDDGVDVDHEEFAGKVQAPRDATRGSNDARPKLDDDNHGTACAGVACAAGKKAFGVAPDARLMPIRLRSELGSQAEADAFVWAADNGADVISCSWGPADGRWWNPNDALHHQRVALPDSTRLAIDYAIRTGRNGKGCVICWAAGNGNESVENDGYASYGKVMAVAACNDRGKRSVYSDYGASIWCAFPSNDFRHRPSGHPAPLTPGIWTTDREGALGYNPGELSPTGGDPPGDSHGNYTESFGGTSSACPGVAGIAALVIAANPELRWDEVKSAIQRSCQRIDETGGSYGADGHSPLYGYGRPDAADAVALARSLAQEPVEVMVLDARATGTLQAQETKLFAIDLPASATVQLDGPEPADFDLYLRRQAPPTLSEYDQRGWTSDADETLRVQTSVGGRYFIMVHAYRGSGEFSVRVSLSG